MEWNQSQRTPMKLNWKSKANKTILIFEEVNFLLTTFVNKKIYLLFFLLDQFGGSQGSQLCFTHICHVRRPWVFGCTLSKFYSGSSITTVVMYVCNNGNTGAVYDNNENTGVEAPVKIRNPKVCPHLLYIYVIF